MSSLINEEEVFSFSASVYDLEAPPQILTFSLVGAPVGASIVGSTGVFTWTPTEEQGPGTYTFTVKVTDNGTPNLSDEEEITVTVNEVNRNPVLSLIGDKTVNEMTELTFDADATDPDVPANTLTFSLVGAPVGASIVGSTGVFTWTPTEEQGPGTYTFTVKVTDNGTPNLSDEEEITVTVNEVNRNPVLSLIGDKTVNEMTELTFDADATDPDVPANTLTFSLVGAPVGASIVGSTGVFTWTPTEEQGPGTYTFTVKVTDNGTPNLSDEEEITVTVNEVNRNPVLSLIGDKTVNEMTELTFDADATDPDVPANTLTFSLVGAPVGASIVGSTGVFTWTPTEEQGPGTYTFTVKVTDNGTPNLSDEEEITVTVNEVNRNPVLSLIGDKTVNEMTELTFDADATDPDVPANTLTFSLVGAPVGASIVGSTGVFTWTPTEEQGPGTYTFTVKVTDNGTPNLSDEEEITVTVNEVNRNPVLSLIGDKTVNEMTELTFDADATDPDVPANTLTFSLVGAPVGASIVGSTGVFTWTPTEEQGPGTYTFTVKVTDNGTPNLSDEEEITVTVNEVNRNPVLSLIGDKTVNEMTELTFDADATDPDVPANTLTFSLVGAPVGASIVGSTGVFTWTPTEEQGPGTYTFTVKVTDNGTPNLSDEEEITVTVNEVNRNPVLSLIGDKTVNEMTELTFDADATDPDVPANTLTFSLVGAPVGASIVGSTGVFTWTPTEEQGPGTYTFTVKVTDNGTPNLSDEEEITVTVNEVNRNPVLSLIGDKTVNEMTELTFDADATDPDVPANTLTFSLVGAPVGASIVGSTGVFTWTPTEEQGPGTYTFTVKVTDNGTPNLSDEEEITVTVNEVNRNPVLSLIGDKTVNEMTELTFDADATDPDVPANTLTFSLVGAPVGASIVGSTGVFTWTPTEEQGPGTYTFTVKVTDNGTPNLSDEEEITVTVNEVNRNPVLSLIGDKTVNEMTELTFDADATDPDVPANTLTFSLVGAPVGASIVGSTGVFTWTPTEEQGPGTYTFTVKVTDNGTPNLSDEEEITVTVNEVNRNPVLSLIGDKTVNEMTELTFDADATDPDVPANTLTFSLVGAPVGASIVGSTGVFTWTPTEEQGPGTYTFTVKVTDNGTPNLSDEEEITVTVNEVNRNPVLSLIGDKTVNEMTELTFDADATDPDVPANTLTFSLVGAPVGASIVGSTGVFTWTPTEEQGPGTYTFTVKVTDNGTPNLSDEEEITVTVNEVNRNPVLSLIGDKTVNEMTELTFDADATDPDVPANTLTFSLVGAPVGASIVGSTGVFTWTPTEEQGPGTYTFTVKVTDNGTPNLSDEEEITVTVNEVNRNPVLSLIGDKTVNEMTELTFDADATDPDVPANTLTFSLVGAPVGASIVGSTGVFTWTPTEEQGPGTYTFTVKVTDNGTPNLSDEEEITVTVNEVNRNPVLSLIGDKTVNEMTELTFDADATDPDVPANTLTFSLVGAPVGASIVGSTGVFTWTPTEEQGPGTYTFTVKVTDNGTPNLSDEEEITVTVNEVNRNPVLSLIGDKTVNEMTELTFDADATDPDVPANTLTFSLVGAPVGASIVGSTGVFTWTPTEEQGPGTYTFTVKVTDNGTPNLSDEEEITVTVNEVNRNPVLSLIGDKTVNEMTELTFNADATDPDVPANTLTFSLVGAPVGASIVGSTGVFTWTPTEEQGPGTYTFTVKVTDNGTPNLSDEEEITVTVNEVNRNPVLSLIGDKTVNEMTELTFDADATDPDVPANTLTFSLVGAPVGASIVGLRESLGGHRQRSRVREHIRSR